MEIYSEVVVQHVPIENLPDYVKLQYKGTTSVGFLPAPNALAAVPGTVLPTAARVRNGTAGTNTTGNGTAPGTVARTATAAAAVSSSTNSNPFNMTGNASNGTNRSGAGDLVPLFNMWDGLIDFPHAVLLLFNIMFENNWTTLIELLCASADATPMFKIGVRCYFTSFHFISALLIVSLLIALVWEAFTTMMEGDKFAEGSLFKLQFKSDDNSLEQENAPLFYHLKLSSRMYLKDIPLEELFTREVDALEHFCNVLGVDIKQVAAERKIRMDELMAADAAGVELTTKTRSVDGLTGKWLVVHILEARELLNVAGSGETSDPYCSVVTKMRMGSNQQVVSTAMAKNNLAPQWDEAFILGKSKSGISGVSKLEVKVLHKTTLGRDVLMGVVTFSIDEIVATKGQTSCNWFKLQCSEAMHQVNIMGHVRVGFSIVDKKTLRAYTKVYKKYVHKVKEQKKKKKKRQRW